MAKIYDNTSRFLMSFDTTSWAQFLGINTDKAELCNADLSTVASQADAILLIGEDRKSAAHVEIQASYDSDMGIRIVLYYALGFKTLGLPLKSYLILLRPEADNAAINGVVKHIDESNGSTILEFHYNVIRVWQLKAEDLIESGLGVLPLAFIAEIDSVKLPDLVKRAEERLERLANPGTIGEFWTSIDILMGLKYDRKFVVDLLKGVRAMKESVTYQGILEDGMRMGEARGEMLADTRVLLRIGTKRFGQPDSQTRAAIDAIDSTEKLEDLIDRCLIVSSWTELLA